LVDPAGGDVDQVVQDGGEAAGAEVGQREVVGCDGPGPGVFAEVAVDEADLDALAGIAEVGDPVGDERAGVCGQGRVCQGDEAISGFCGALEVCAGGGVDGW